MVRVDNETFTWMGAPLDIPSANQTAYEYTSTRSIFTIEVTDKVSLKAVFDLLIYACRGVFARRLRARCTDLYRRQRR